MIRVLIVEDNSFHRKILKEALSKVEGVEVLGTANNGKIALDKIAQLNPDLITLDVEMPEMDGIETLRHLKHIAPQITVIMVSAYTVQGARVTMEALALGAFDFITKPEGTDLKSNIDDLRFQLKAIINASVVRKKIRSILNGRLRDDRPVSESAPVDASLTGKSSISGPVDIVAIGTSTGGPRALTQVIPKLPHDLKVPVTIVQHMPPVFSTAFAESLDKESSVTVVEARSGQRLEPATVYLAPGGKHMKVVRQEKTGHPGVLITDDPPENNCKPSADYLFRSVADLYRNRALGVIMTGMGVDGALGLKLMKRRGARVIAQDQASCVVFSMPSEAIKAGAVDEVLRLERIADEIILIVNRRK
ncbi:chemotaxis response regulator protein-glutamate methylesterase [Gemmatimonadota bacterium]